MSYPLELAKAKRAGDRMMVSLTHFLEVTRCILEREGSLPPTAFASGADIVAWRQSRGISQDALAKALDVGLSTLRRHESAAQIPRIWSLALERFAQWPWSVIQ
jgi:DNA-binding transcriptional regulator YiaG